jgi:high affinity sulfate transporter 1
MKLPILSGVLPYDRSRLPGDIAAGLTLAALGIPEVMGYTKISGTPVVTGLYTILLPLVVFALIGGSRHLVVAADSATAAILAGMLVAVAALGSPEYVGLTSTVALAVAVMLVLARVFRLGFLADFLSRSALVGFLTGVGVQVAAGELSGLLGLEKQGHGAFQQVVSVFSRLAETHTATLGACLAVLAIIGGCSRFAPRVPGALIAVLGAIAVSATIDLPQYGLAIIGEVPSGLPSLLIPTLKASEIYQVLATAATCFIVILAQSAATSRAYANRYNEKFDENLDLVGLAGANAAAAFTGTFVVNGSPTKTEMVDSAGGRSQIAHLTTAIIVLVVILFLTKPLSLMPSFVLSAIVFHIGLKLIDVKGMRELFRLQKSEFIIALATAATLVFGTVLQGILLAVLLSLIDQVRHSYQARTRILIRGAAGNWKPVPVAPGIVSAPGIIVYRFESNLFYANVGRFMEEVLGLIEHAGQPLRAIVIDASGIDDVDFTAAKTLIQLRAELDRRGIGLATVATTEGVLETLQRYRTEEITRSPFFGSVSEAIDALAVTGPEVQR